MQPAVISTALTKNIAPSALEDALSKRVVRLCLSKYAGHALALDNNRQQGYEGQTGESLRSHRVNELLSRVLRSVRL